MSVNIMLVGKDHALAITDRRITIDNLVSADDLKVNKLTNYFSKDLYLSLAFVESRDPLLGYIGENRLLASRIIEDMDRGFGCAIDIIKELSGRGFREFYKGLCASFMNVVSGMMLFDSSHHLPEVIWAAVKTLKEGKGDEALMEHSKGIVSSFRPYDARNLPVFSYVAYSGNAFQKGLIRYDMSSGTVKAYEADAKPFFATGGGAKLAEGYLSGLDSPVSEMSLPYLLVHGSNAYVWSKQSPLVGGTFKVSIVGPEGIMPLSRPKRCAMNTLSAAFLAGMISEGKVGNGKITGEDMVGIFSEIFSGEDSKLEDVYNRIASLTGQSVEAVKTGSVVIDYFLERAGLHHGA